MSLPGLLLAALGVVFYWSGSLGLLRFPDVYSRLHALTKADTLGLGFVVLGLALQAQGPGQLLRLGLMWLITVAAGAVSAQLVAAFAAREGQRPWRR